MNDRLLHIWMDLTGLVVPLIALAVGLLGVPDRVGLVLTAIFFAGVLSTWLLLTDLPRWRATQRARLRRMRRRGRALRRRTFRRA